MSQQFPVDRDRRRKKFAELISATQSALLRVARRLCTGNDDCAEDLVQDAYVAGYQAYVEGRFREGSNAKAWLMRIMTNKFINEIKRDQKWRAPVTVEELTSGGAAGPISTHIPKAQHPDNLLIDSLLDEQLESALKSLSLELRACVILVDIEGYDYAEAAKALGIPIGTVRSRLFRARMQMHEFLTKLRHRI